MTCRLRLIIAYAGGPFAGWQSQANGRAVQDHLEAALSALCNGRQVTVHGSGRTDAGVHARGQCAHVDVPEQGHSLDRWRLAINAGLPPEVRVLQVARAAPDFQARFDARGKIYEYRIWNSPVLDPFERGRAWHLPGDLDLETLRKALTLFVGRHDFAAFCANRGIAPETTVRTIRRVRLKARGVCIALRFAGDGFLYRMVRLMVGAAVRCAQHRAELHSIAMRLRDGPAAPKNTFCAPAEGLYLMRVLYSRRSTAAGASAEHDAQTNCKR